MTDLTGTPPSPRLRTPPRPYARQRKHTSVTTYLGAMGKDGLQHGAAKETAMFAFDLFDEWRLLEREEAIDRLRKHFIGLWDGRAAMGTLVHEVNERWTWGETADIDELVAEFAGREKRPVKIWQGRERFVAVEAQGYVDGLERFWTDFQPTTVSTEEVVRRPGDESYIGQRDWVADIDGQRTLLDMKTTANQDDAKGYYWDSWRLQLAAYRFAPEIVTYDDEGNETGTLPNYPVDRCGVLHLRGGGHYSFFEVQAGPAELATFDDVCRVHRWQKKGCEQPRPRDLTPVLVIGETAA